MTSHSAKTQPRPGLLGLLLLLCSCQYTVGVLGKSQMCEVETGQTNIILDIEESRGSCKYFILIINLYVSLYTHGQVNLVQRPLSIFVSPSPSPLTLLDFIRPKSLQRFRHWWRLTTTIYRRFIRLSALFSGTLATSPLVSDSLQSLVSSCFFSQSVRHFSVAWPRRGELAEVKTSWGESSSYYNKIVSYALLSSQRLGECAFDANRIKVLT